MSDPLKIVIGYDRNEVPAFHTLVNSILTRSSRPVEIVPLHEPTLRADNLYWRQDRGSTDFAFSRFLAPYMAAYRGKVLFMDCDMVCRGDIAEIFGFLDSSQAVAVCKHDYKPTNATKFLGNKQSSYPKKLWSAVTLFNCANQRVKSLTPKQVNEMSGADLHQFTWAGHESRIGEIPEEWHYIPGHSSARVNLEDAKLIHFTEGGPWFKDYEDTEGADIWREEYERLKP